MNHKTSIAWIPFGRRNSPSSRLRAYAVADGLKNKYGVESIFPPFTLTQAPDCLAIEKICDPAALDLANKLKQLGTRIVYDVCDPIWLKEDVNRQRHWDVNAMVQLADCVTVPTQPLADAVRERWNVSCVTVIPDRIIAIDSTLPAPAVPKERNPLRIGWFGTSLNMEHISMIAPSLSQMHKEQPIVLRLITQPHQGMVSVVADVPAEYVPWTLSGYEDAMRECDMMLLPMQLRAETYTKSSNRLQLCMALGLPVVASPLASYLEFVKGSEHLTSFANSPEEWFTAMASLRSLPRRQEISTTGYDYAQKHCLLTEVLPHWIEALFGHNDNHLLQTAQ